MTRLNSSATAEITTTSQEYLSSARAWFIYSLAALAFGYAFFQRVAPSVMVSDLMAQFAIGGGMLGILSALYFYPYVLLQVPLGALIDRYGARALLVCALTLAGIGSIIFATADNLNAAYLGRVLIGVGSSVGFLGSLALAAKWFPVNQFAMLAGMTMFFGMTSGMLAQGPLAVFVETFGWRASQWSLGAFGLVLALMIFIFVRNAPPGVVDEKPKQNWRSIVSGLRRAAGTLDVWKVAIVASAMSGPMLTLGGLWGTPYLMETYDLARPQAAFFVSFLLLGWAFGAPISGWLSDRIQRRKPLLIAGCAVLSIALALIVFIPHQPLSTIILILVITGFSGAAMSICFALVREVTPPEITGSALGIVNGMTVASGAILQPLVGFALDYLWGGETVNGSPVYQPEDFQTAFGLVLGAAILGLLVSLTLPRAQLKQ